MLLLGWEYIELRSTGPNWVPLLATRCLYQGVGYIWPEVSLTQRLTKCQADLKYYHSWLVDASTRGGGGGTEDIGVTGWGTCDQRSAWPEVDQMSCWPAVVQLLTTRCLYWGWRWGVSRGLTGGIGMSGSIGGLHLKNEDGLLQTENVLLKTLDALLNTEDNRTSAQVNWSQVSTTHGH